MVAVEKYVQVLVRLQIQNHPDSLSSSFNNNNVQEAKSSVVIGRPPSPGPSMC